jgi:thiol-disulfide isomerase/thioredoxin
VAVESQTTELRTPLPDVTLPDVDGVEHDLRAVASGQPLLVVFACNHCPYVRWLEEDLARLIAESGIHAVAINSNDVREYPEDGPDGMREQRARAGWGFPYLIDADQSVARAFGAVCTPDFFLYDAEGLLAYRGAFDASSPKNGQPRTGDLLRTAIADVQAGRPVPEPHRPAMGCGIKWTQS